MATTSKKKPARATIKKKKKPTPNIRAVGTNPCDDQNGMLLCWGGHPTNKPFPTSGGPWMPVVAYNSTTGLMELQWADLGTICPGTLATVAAPCKPCGGGETAPEDTALFDAPATEQVSESEATSS